jgi:predicted DNA-binding protein
MRFFFRKKDEPRPVEAAKKQRAEYKVNMTGSNYSEMRQNDSTLKVWLPEAVEMHLDELTTYLQTSVSDLLRQILFQHLYGRYDLIGLVERQKFNPEEPYPGIRFSCAPCPPGTLSTSPPPAPKKAVGVKVFIPERMRKDLDNLAGSKHKTISEYVREVLFNHLYGAFHSKGLQTTPPSNADEGIEKIY